MSFQRQPTECDCGCDRRRREAIDRSSADAELHDLSRLVTLKPGVPICRKCRKDGYCRRVGPVYVVGHLDQRMKHTFQPWVIGDDR
jgi:hypothetical protein